MIARVDLTSGSRRHARRERRRLQFWGIGATVYLAALAIGVLVVRSGLAQDRSELRSRVETLAASNQRTLAEISSLNAQISAIQRTIAANRAVSEQPDWSVLLVLLSELSGEEVSLAGFRLEPSEGAARSAETAIASFDLTFAGLAKSPSAMNAFVDALEGTGLFGRVRLNGSQLTKLNGVEATSFDMECSLVAVETSP